MLVWQLFHGVESMTISIARMAPHAPNARRIFEKVDGVESVLQPFTPNATSLSRRQGEWKVRKHGYSRRRSRRKVHLRLGLETGRVRAALVTHRDIDDAA